MTTAARRTAGQQQESNNSQDNISQDSSNSQDTRVYCLTRACGTIRPRAGLERGDWTLAGLSRPGWTLRARRLDSGLASLGMSRRLQNNLASLI